MRASRLRPPATLLFGGQQIGVEREAPPPVALFAQDRERVAGAAHRRAAGRRHRHLDVIAKIQTTDGLPVIAIRRSGLSP
jgi:hypothetical protein